MYGASTKNTHPETTMTGQLYSHTYLNAFSSFSPLVSFVFTVPTEVGALELRSNHGSGGAFDNPDAVEVSPSFAFSISFSRSVSALDRIST
jgi:hypothetical protein